MNNEPVAWVDGLCLALIHKCKSEWVKVYREKKDDEYIPLYDHPAKTYEDAIEECAQRAEAYAYMSPNFMALAEELRAILRKAQEK